MSSAFDDVLDPKTESKSDYGVSARRKAHLANYDASLDTLAAHGVEVPHKDFNPENEQEFPTTVHVEGADGVVSVSLFQDVREDMDTGFGDINDDEDVIWTVVALDDGTVNLTVVGEWSQRREVPYKEFARDYDPITVTVTDGNPDCDDVQPREVPRYGY